MRFWLILFGVFLAGGLFFILADVLKLPKVKTLRAMISAGRQAKVKTKFFEALLIGWATRLAKYTRIDEYKHHRMSSALNAAGMDMTPELIIAYAITKTGCILLCIIPCMIVLPILSPVVIILAILTYFKTVQSPDEKLKEKRDAIEQELPRFVATITQELKTSRDILSIVDNYKRNAGGMFASELDILTADMRSSSYEASITRFEARINSPQISDIARGLISVLRGDDGAVYFQMLTHDMQQLEFQRLKAKALKIPPKIRRFSFILLMSFLFMYLAIIVYEIMISISGLF